MALDRTRRRQADRALSWYAAGRRARDVGTAITAYATAIESLLPDPQGSVCRHCGQQTFKISSRFKQFLDDSADPEMREAFRNAIYRIRSRLSHGESLYEVDDTGRSEASDDHLKVWGTTRAALLNWLLAQEPEDREPGVGARA